MKQILEYAISEQLYESSNFLIYRGMHQKTRQPVVLKRLWDDYPSPQKVAGFQHEYEITKLFQDSGIIQVYGIEKWQNTWVLIMEDFGGQALRRWITDNNVDIGTFLDMAIQITESLAVVHQQKVIHKDINPANILWNPQTRKVKLINFGLSSRQAITRIEPLVFSKMEGTLNYISPEQTGRMNRAIDYRTDFYSLGATFYFILTGTPPFVSSDPMELVHCHIAKELSFPPEADIPEMLQHLIRRLMEKTAESRYQNALSLKHDLEICKTHWKFSQTLPAFSLGQTDRFDQFQVPEKLYGREKEIQILLDSYDRIQAGKSELVLVSGYSGIGKTSLVHEMHKPIVAKRGRFISGKSDQYQRNIPYSVFIQAFQTLLQQILTEPDNVIRDWKEKILKAVGENGQLIVEVLPELELVIDKQNFPIPLPTREAQNRFNGCFQNFVSVFATAGHPLVLFLDDLQWADFSSLKLIELLMTDLDSCFLLMILSWRSNEVDQAHPLTRTLQEIQQKQVAIHAVQLEPLGENHVNQMLAETLRHPLSETLPLAQLLLKKTGGNPFFLKQLLTSLVHAKRIEFELNSLSWRWDINLLIQERISENVVDLIVSQLNKQKHDLQILLRSAACMGSLFDIHLLALLHQNTMKEIIDILREAIQEEWVIPPDQSWESISENETRSLFFHFAHDRIQQAAASQLSESETSQLHYNFGKLMLQNWTADEQEEYLFELISHLNQALSLIENDEEKNQILYLNVRAARKAKLSLAYETEFQCLKNAQSLLKHNAWEVNYHETLSLYTELTKAAFHIGNFSEMDHRVNEVLNHAKSIFDKIPVYLVKSDQYIANGRLLEGIKLLLPILAELGMFFSANPEPSEIRQKLFQVNSQLDKLTIEQLLALPKLDNPEKLAAIKICVKLLSTTYRSVPRLFPLVVMGMLENTLSIGNHEFASLVYSMYGIVMIVLAKDPETALMFADLAEKLLEKNEKTSQPAILHGCYAFIRHHKESLKNSFQGLWREHELAIEVGNFEYVALSSYFICTYSLFIGNKLDKLHKEMVHHIQLMKKLKQTAYLNYTLPWYQIVLNLRENTEPFWKLEGTACPNPNLLKSIEQLKDSMALFQFHCAQAILAYWGRDYELAERHIIVSTQYFAFTGSFLAHSLFDFYRCLIALALYDQADTEKQSQIMAEIKTWEVNVKFSADHSPTNNLHRWYLVEAEKYRVLGHILEAQDAYDSAIEHAGKNGFIQDEAMVNELTGKFYLKRNKKRIAKLYLTEALYLYEQWGANALVQRMIHDYGDLLELRSERVSKRNLSETISTTATSTTEDSRTQSHSSVLDITTLLKSSQTLSEEIHLDKLLEKIMRIMVENAGAQKGVLLLKNQQWQIQAVTDTSSRKVEVFQGIPLDSASSLSQLPRTIVQYVIRTGQNLVLDNAQKDKRFNKDLYVVQHSLKSVLCEPILHQGQFTAILYLENNLTPGAFTSDRLEVLKMLSTQAAISIENSQLYEILEGKVQKRTLQLQQTTEELAEKNEKLAKASRFKSEFLANMSHEIRTPMNAVIGFSGLALKTELTPKQYDYIVKIESSAKSLLGLINDILDFSKIEAGKLEMESIDFNLEDVMNSVANIVSVKAAEKDIEFIHTTETDVPIALIGDPLRLGQILINLANNAVKFTQSGHVFVKTELREKDAHSCLLKFSVSDTGIGMTDEQMAKLFSAFSQADNSITRKFGGTGLGLTISKSLVEMMDGKISVTSEIGKGSTFSFTVHFFHKLLNPKKNYSIPKDLKGLKVLIVDDNKTALEIYEEQIKSFGFSVTTVDSGAKAIQELEKSSSEDSPYELVLMDYRMPKMDGIETSKRIKQNANLAHIPLTIMITAFGHDEVIKQAEQAGIKTFLMKPANPSLMFNTIMEVLGRETVPDTRQKHIPESSAEHMDMDRIKNARVLLVEDNVLNQQVATEILMNAGIVVEIANSGKKAIDAINQNQYDLVFMDVQMPVMSGYEATGLIRQNEKFKELPIIALTAHAMSGAKEECIKEGMNDYVSKPIDPDQLYKVLLQWIKPGIRKLREEQKNKPEQFKQQDMCIEFPEILAGIDIESGIARIKGNKRLFKELLIDFSKKYVHITEKIRKEIEKGDYHAAKNLAHTIKGISGNISANTLHASAGELERAINEKKEEQYISILSNFDKDLQQVLNSLKIFEQPDVISAYDDTTINIDKLKPIVIEIYNFIKNDSPEASESLLHLKECISNSKIMEEIKKLDEQINKFDFPNAVNLLETIAIKMNISLK